MKKNNIFKVLIGLCFVLLGINCGGDDGGGGGGGEDGPQLSLSPTSVDLDATGSKQITIAVTSNTSWNVSKDANANWLTIGSSNGSKNGSFNIWAEDNKTGSDRSATITVQVTRGSVYKTVTVRQAAGSAASQLDVSTTSIGFDYTGGNNTFRITSNVSSWTVASDKAWCTVSPASGSNNGTVTVSTTANSDNSGRTATITVSGGGLTRTVTINQSEKPVDYTLTVDKTSLSFGAAEETKSILVTSNDSWTVESNQSWCKVSPTSGSSNGTVDVTVTGNTSASTRSCTITFKGANSGITRTVEVTQDQPSNNNSVGRDDYGNDVDLNNK